VNPDDAKRLDDMLLKRRKEIGARVTAEEEYEQMKGELAQFTSYARAVVVALALAALLVAAAFFTVFGIMGGFKGLAAPSRNTSMNSGVWMRGLGRPRPQPPVR
jgi:hypothetical protein